MVQSRSQKISNLHGILYYTIGINIDSFGNINFSLGKKKSLPINAANYLGDILIWYFTILFKVRDVTVHKHDGSVQC